MYVFRHRFWVVGLLGAVTAALATLAACLPDLDPIGAVDAGVGFDVETLTPFSGCGDGFIETLDDGGDAGESCDPGPDASVPGCESCHFTCAGGAIDDAGHCYFAVGENEDFATAYNACEARQAHLVTFASTREAEFVSALAEGGTHWVGLNLTERIPGSAYGPVAANEPGWPRSTTPCSGCFALGASVTNAFEIHATALARIDAGTASAEARCLVAEAGRWLQTFCSGGERFETICEREPVGHRQFFCGGAHCTTLAATAGKKRYVLSIETATADQAAEACKSRYAAEKGKLVVFETREEREQLVREILTRFTPASDEPLSLWIGLSSLASGGWTWEDGVVADGANGRPLPWGVNQPTDAGTSAARAFILVTSATRVDQQLAYPDDGTTQRRYVCQRELPSD